MASSLADKDAAKPRIVKRAEAALLRFFARKCAEQNHALALPQQFSVRRHMKGFCSGEQIQYRLIPAIVIPI